MKISQVIKMLEKEIEKHGDIQVYIDLDWGGEREVLKDNDPLAICPEYQKENGPLPERIVI